jgi:hypothetical protein
MVIKKFATLLATKDPSPLGTRVTILYDYLISLSALTLPVAPRRFAFLLNKLLPPVFLR